MAEKVVELISSQSEAAEIRKKVDDGLNVIESLKEKCKKLDDCLSRFVAEKNRQNSTMASTSAAKTAKSAQLRPPPTAKEGKVCGRLTWLL